MSRRNDLTGQKFNRLTALSFVGKDASNNARWLFRCDCGAQTEARGSEVVRGSVASCGCLVRDATRAANVSHDMAKTKVYKVWIAMRRRCTNPADVTYADYGGRGIIVCGRWLDSFENFFADMGEPPAGLSLDRIDNNGDYSPDNCRWSDDVAQHRNKRNSRVWTLYGVDYPSAPAAAAALGVGVTTITKWCLGYTSRGVDYLPRLNCKAEKRYGV